MKKRQVICIHGADAYESYEDYLKSLKSFELTFDQLKKKRWRNGLQDELGESYEVILPEMPCGFNARYVEWKIWFDKIVPFLTDDVILVGHSMGGIFLVKYLSENKVNVRVAGTILISAPYDDENSEDKLMDFNLPESIENFKNQAGKIVMLQSEDDVVVPFADFEKYTKVLPQAQFLVFKDRGHFISENFPELIEIIKDIN